ncbi:tyrosine-type recombinase/integrase [Noviherbaspirillum autotrophicum]|uniref:tyrosine-type recombinase/integrase n=1 Tax=Noviherbaspirillum autotrophicum TaxID=709839 RepID=UPI001E583063|nr:tyrosine-type recombinase/integrase [Noviherbaspirillum autotrophicum]
MVYRAFVYTRNVDGQFQEAGFDASRVVACHGAIHWLRHTAGSHMANQDIDLRHVRDNLGHESMARPAMTCTHPTMSDTGKPSNGISSGGNSLSSPLRTVRSGQSCL